MPIYDIVGFHWISRLDDQVLSFIEFYRPPGTLAQYNDGTEKIPKAGINLDSDQDIDGQCFGQIVSCSEHSTKDDSLQPTTSLEDFITYDVKDLD